MKEKYESADAEMREHLNSKVMNHKDVDRHTLKFKEQRDLKHLTLKVDEGY